MKFKLDINDEVVNINLSWDDIKDKPETFPSSTHNHDDIYYTETEIDEKLSTVENSIPSVSEIETKLMPQFNGYQQVASCSSNNDSLRSTRYTTEQAGWYVIEADLSKSASREDYFKCYVSVNGHYIACVSSLGDNYSSIFYLPNGIEVTIQAAFANCTLYFLS